VPRDNKIKENTFVNNGTAPPPWHPLAGAAADIIEGYVNLPYGSDPTAGNCYEDNHYSTYVNIITGQPEPPQCD